LLDKSDINDMIDKVQQYMKPNGMFIQYLYSLSRYRFFKRRFDKVGLKMTLLNVPPAIVYRCTNNE
jgi:phospholipid N-methyltransferase